MNTIILAIALLQPGHTARVHVHTLQQQTQESDTRANSGASTVIVYDRASDMPQGRGK